MIVVHRMSLQNKVVYTFNRVLLGFIKDLRKNSTLAKSIGKQHKIFDKESETYLEHFKKQYDVLIKHVTKDKDFTFASVPEVQDIDIIVGTSLRDVFAHCNDPAIDRYLLTLLCIVSASNGDGEDDTAFNIVMEKLQSMEMHIVTDYNDVFDEEIRMLLETLSEKSDENTSPLTDNVVDPNAFPGAEEFMNKMQNSKLGEIAKEITQSLDTNQDFSGENMGNIINTFTSTLQTKISDGSINPQELITDAFNAMQHLGIGGANGLFKNANLNKATLSQMEKQMKTKTRMREKLQRRNEAQR